MPRTSTAERLERLEWIKARLKAGEPTTTGDLAEELGISTRTVSRDLEVLRDQGIPVEADRGRGGGVRIHRSWGAGRIHLTEAEAVDLLVSLAIAEKLRSPLFMAHLGSVRHKLQASFGSDLRARVNRLKARIRIGGLASLPVQGNVRAPSRHVVERLHRAFVFEERLTITYGAEDGSQTKRCIEPHYLLLNPPAWYVLAYDALRDDLRTFRCDRIRRARPPEGSFCLLPLARFAEALAGTDTV